jgi:DNA invertase Pin-like site-specific DNA recombinase
VINYTTPGTDMKFIENPVSAIAEDELRKVASTTMRGMLAATRRTKKGG